MPFCLLVVPPWFLRKYPDVDRALRTNQNRLTSHFDVHATLRHILYFDGGAIGSSSNDNVARTPLTSAGHETDMPSSRTGGERANSGRQSDIVKDPHGAKNSGKQELNNNVSENGRKIKSGKDYPANVNGGLSPPADLKCRTVKPDNQHRQRRSAPSHTKPSTPYSKPARGMSLFREIPRDRTCRDAGIDFQWCSCNRLEPVDTQDALVRLLAFEFALQLSDKTLRARELCHQLNLAKVRSAMKVTLAGKEKLEGAGNLPKQPFSKLLMPQVSANSTTTTANSSTGPAETSLYLLSIETRPGGAVFEGHLQFSQADGSVRLLGTVLRLNMFQPQSMCVDEPGLKPFCYCKDLDDKKT